MSYNVSEIIWCIYDILEVFIDGNATVDVGKNATLKVGGNFQADISGTCKMTSGGNMTFKAPRIDLN